MHILHTTLKSRGWTVRPAKDKKPLLPPWVARRYPKLPANVVAFLSSVAICHNQAENAWFLTGQDYRRRTGSAFRWNEYEHMALESAEDEPECAAIKSFWDGHFPLMLAVHSDYDYLALRLAGKKRGSIVHGYAPEWDEPSVIAPSFATFLKEFTAAASLPQAEYPFNVFL